MAYIPWMQNTGSQNIGIAALDTFPERRVLFDEEQMAEGRAERCLSEDHTFAPGDVHVIERPSLIRPIESPIHTSTAINTIPSETIQISSGVPGVVMYGGGPAAPIIPGASGIVVNMGTIRIASSGGGGSGDSSSSHRPRIL